MTPAERTARFRAAHPDYPRVQYERRLARMGKTRTRPTAAPGNVCALCVTAQAQQHSPWCKPCGDERRRKWRQEWDRERNRRLRSERPEMVRAWKARDYERNGDKIRARAKQWRVDNPEKAAEQSRAKRVANPLYYQACSWLASAGLTKREETSALRELLITYWTLKREIRNRG